MLNIIKYRVLVVLTSCAVAVGCVTTDPYTGEQKTSNAAKGAGIGAITGAIIGAASASKKDRKKGVLTGAAAGAAIGGGIGYYMDRQEAALRQKLQGSGVRVKREGNNIRLVMPGNITFATARHEIRSDFYPVLDSVGAVLQEFTKTSIHIAGHTDSKGSDDYNQGLSERRANSVRQYLVRTVAPTRVQAVGYGERYPVDTNATDRGRQENRRVELELHPIEG